LLSHIREIDVVPVGMPNGIITDANKRGSVRLNDKLMLHDVLFVPSLNCNLISIAQLIENLYCTVTLTRKSCVIQDLTTKVLIESGEHRRGCISTKEDR